MRKRSEKTCRPGVEALPGRIMPSVPGPLASAPIEPVPIVLVPVVSPIPLAYSTITVAQLVPPDELFD